MSREAERDLGLAQSRVHDAVAAKVLGRPAAQRILLFVLLDLLVRLDAIPVLLLARRERGLFAKLGRVVGVVVLGVRHWPVLAFDRTIGKGRRIPWALDCHRLQRIGDGLIRRFSDNGRMEHTETRERAGSERIVRRLVEGELTKSIIGAFYDIYNQLDYGFLEAIYVEALSRELVRRAHSSEPEVGDSSPIKA